MNDWHLHEQLLGITVDQLVICVVPLAAFEVHAVGVTSGFRLLSNILHEQVRLDDKAEADLIDGDIVLSRVVLLRTSEESLREEESRNPEANRSSIVKPVGQEFDSIVAVLNP